MKNQIPEFLIKEFKKKSAKTTKFPTNIKEFIISFGVYYNYDLHDNIYGIYQLMKNGITEIPLCEYKGCKNRKQINSKPYSIKAFGVLSKGCCSKHTRIITTLEKFGVESTNQLDSVKDKKKQSYIKNYGVDNPMKNIDCKLKAKNTRFKKYGVEHMLQNPLYYNKMRHTNLIKYGTKFPQELDNIKNKIADKCLLLYGETNPSKLSWVKEKVRNTKIEKYGFISSFNKPAVYKKRCETMIERYGTPYVSQVPEFLEKIQKSTYSFKKYIWKTGEISLVQGYEPIVLKELEDSGYGYNDILTSPKDMPKIIYQLDEKEHRYFPDIFIPKDKIIIEVKSEYTLQVDWDKNQAKFEATKSLGFDFRLEVR